MGLSRLARYEVILLRWLSRPWLLMPATYLDPTPLSATPRIVVRGQ